MMAGCWPVAGKWFRRTCDGKWFAPNGAGVDPDEKMVCHGWRSLLANRVVGKWSARDSGWKMVCREWPAGAGSLSLENGLRRLRDRQENCLPRDYLPVNCLPTTEADRPDSRNAKMVCENR